MTVLLIVAAVIVVLAIAAAVIAWAAVMLALIGRLPPAPSSLDRWSRVRAGSRGRLRIAGKDRK